MLEQEEEYTGRTGGTLVSNQPDPTADSRALQERRRQMGEHNASLAAARVAESQRQTRFGKLGQPHLTPRAAAAKEQSNRPSDKILTTPTDHRIEDKRAKRH